MYSEDVFYSESGAARRSIRCQEAAEPKRPSRNNYAELRRDRNITARLRNRVGRAQVLVAHGVA
mgnify:CR=1 FL=1